LSDYLADSSGELAYYKYVYRFENTENSVDKNSNVRLTNEYDTITGDNIRAQRTITTTTTIDTCTFTESVMIQEDIDLDGVVDVEMALEQAFETLQITTISTEVTKIREYDDNNVAIEEISLTETINRSYTDSRDHHSLSFTDYMNGDVSSSRTYEDVFPNELADGFQLDKFTQQITDASGVSTVQAPDVSQLLAVSHSTDNVPVQFDSKTDIIAETHQFTISNALSSEEAISIPQGLGTEVALASINTIQVTPDDGVYYDNNPGDRSDKVVGGTYYYVDSDNDAAFDTIFIADGNGEILGVGFDYDFDGYFEPNKEESMGIHRLDHGISDESSILSQYKNDETIYYLDSNNGRMDGVFPEPVFSDSLFDLWKTQYSVGVGEIGTSVLLTQAAVESYNTLMENTDPATDFWQQMASTAVGAVLSIPMGGVGFMIGYGLTSFAFQVAAKQKNDKKVASRMIHGTGPQEKHTLSSKSWIDSFWEGNMFEAIRGMQTSVYAPIRHQTDNHEYEGQLILAGMGNKFDFFLSKQFIASELDYSLQTRNYIGLSDFEDWRLPYFLNTMYGPDWNRIGEFTYMDNNVMNMEEKVASISQDGEPLTSRIDKIVPTIVPVEGYNTPLLEFGDSGGNGPLPEFYEDYPIFLPDNEYQAVKNSYHDIYKIYDGNTNEVQLLPEDSVHTLHSDIIEVIVYRLSDFVTFVGCDVHEVTRLYAGDFEVDRSTGIVTVNEVKHSYLNDQIQSGEVLLFRFVIEKYRSIDDTRNLVDPSNPLTTEQVQTIATMQAAQKSVLEYFYQSQLGSSVGISSAEMAYTVQLTLATTAASALFMIPIAASAGLSKIASEWGMKAKDVFSQSLVKGVLGTAARQAVGKAIGQAFLRQVLSLGIEPLQEVFLDPVVETCVSNVVMMGTGNEILAMFASTFSEAGREALSGVITSPLYSSASLKFNSLTHSIRQNKLDTIFGAQYKTSWLENIQDSKNLMRDSSQESAAGNLNGPDLSRMVFASSKVEAASKSAPASLANNPSAIISVAKDILSTAEGIDGSVKEILKDAINIVVKSKAPSAFSTNADTAGELHRAHLAVGQLARLAERVSSKTRAIPVKTTSLKKSAYSKLIDVFRSIPEGMKFGALDTIYKYSGDKQARIAARNVLVQTFGNDPAFLGMMMPYTSGKLTAYSERGYMHAPDGTLVPIPEVAFHHPTDENIGEISYNTLNLIEDLREEIGNLVPGERKRGKLAYWKLSNYLSDKKVKSNAEYHYIKTVRVFLSSNNPKYDPAYLIHEDRLAIFKRNLEINFGSKAKNCFAFIKKYEKLNDLKSFTYGQSRKFNPNLDSDYFSEINTIEKAFWLGFLCADGSLVRDKTGGSIRIFIELAAHDREILEHFCDAIGLDHSKIKPRTRTRNGKEYRSVYLQFKDKKMSNDLVVQGFSSSKAIRKDLPTFWRQTTLDEFTREILLKAYVRGYYDGDGTEGTSSIRAANRQFLESIRNALNIKNSVNQLKEEYSYIDEDGKLHTVGAYFELALGGRLFNDITSLCKADGIVILGRKDLILSEHRSAREKLKENVINKELFQKLVFNIPIKHLARIFGTSEKLIRDLIIEWNLQSPPLGYWVHYRSLGLLRSGADYKNIQDTVYQIIGQDFIDRLIKATEQDKIGLMKKFIDFEKLHRLMLQDKKGEAFMLWEMFLSSISDYPASEIDPSTITINQIEDIASFLIAVLEKPSLVLSIAETFFNPNMEFSTSELKFDKRFLACLNFDFLNK